MNGGQSKPNSITLLFYDHQNPSILLCMIPTKVLLNVLNTIFSGSRTSLFKKKQLHSKIPLTPSFRSEVSDVLRFRLSWVVTRYRQISFSSSFSRGGDSLRVSLVTGPHNPLVLLSSFLLGTNKYVNKNVVYNNVRYGTNL